MNRWAFHSLINHILKGKFTMSEITDIAAATQTAVENAVATINKLKDANAPLVQQVADLTASNTALTADLTAAKDELTKATAQLGAASA